MMIGPTSAAPVLTSMATRATPTSPVSGFISGRKRLTPAPTLLFFPNALEVSRVYFIEICTPLRFVDLDVFRRRLHKAPVRSRGQHLAFHQQDDLVVVLHRRDFLRHRDQRDAGII